MCAQVLRMFVSPERARGFAVRIYESNSTSRWQRQVDIADVGRRARIQEQCAQRRRGGYRH
jgi:hypothetical protein